MDKTQPAEPMTPGQVASNEAAKQAVVLAFGIATVLILMPIYRRIAHAQGQAIRADPVLVKIAALEAARDARARRALKWQRIADVLWPLSPAAAVWALRRAESVSKPPGESGD